MLAMMLLMHICGIQGRTRKIVLSHFLFCKHKRRVNLVVYQLASLVDSMERRVQLLSKPHNVG